MSQILHSISTEIHLELFVHYFKINIMVIFKVKNSKLKVKSNKNKIKIKVKNQSRDDFLQNLFKSHCYYGAGSC